MRYTQYNGVKTEGGYIVKKQWISVWQDFVGVNDLIKAFILASIPTLLGYFLANDTNTTQQLFFGLAGAVIGFLLNTFLIKPKRIVIIGEKQEDSL